MMLRRLTFLGVLVAVVAAASLFGVLGRGGGKAEASGPVTITAVNTGRDPVVYPDTGLPVTPLPNGPCALSNLTPGVGGGPGFTISTKNSGPSGFPCGDGVDEFTNWTFDFVHSTSIPAQKLAEYNAFLACVTSQPQSLQLTSAKLTLTLDSAGDLVSNDGIAMLEKINPLTPFNVLAAGVQSLPQNDKINVPEGLIGLPQPGVVPPTPWPGTKTIVHDWVTGYSIQSNAYLNNGHTEPPTQAVDILTNLLANGAVHPTNAPITASPATLVDYIAGPGSIAMQYQDDALITRAELDLTCGPLPPVGGVADILTGADGSAGNTLPISAAIAAAVVAIAAGGWYTRKRWLP